MLNHPGEADGVHLHVFVHLHTYTLYGITIVVDQ